MDAAKNQILSQLKRDILPLQGFKKLRADNNINIGFRPIEKAFPNACFPIGCMHEFVSNTSSDIAATYGFIACLLSKLMQLGGACVSISTTDILFPPALKSFGVDPEKVIFINLKKEKDILYATEQALKCNKLTAVLVDIKNISFKESRRFQLAAEQSRVTGFIIRNQPYSVNTIACVSRWQITSIASELQDAMPGVGFPRWNVELLKVRNGRPGSWQIEFTDKRLRHLLQVAPIHNGQQKKAG